jgi:CRISPR-associated endonuclease/helicase Cas3
VRSQSLFAKSAASDGFRPTLPQHTEAVLLAAATLLDLTGEAQLRALGFDAAVWLERFRRDLLLAALLHDLGKANSYFQDMVSEVGRVVQPLRHEAVSYWIAKRPQMQNWLSAVVDDALAIELILWAVAGHHRKFPMDGKTALPMEVYLGHADLREALSLGGRELRLPPPPVMDDVTLSFTPATVSVFRELEDAEVEAEDRFGAIAQSEPALARYVALLKASLIAADVAGSIRRCGDETMVDWMIDAFRNVPASRDLEGVVEARLGPNTLHRFQREVGEASERVVFVRAGCGSGKTLAAYHWAARRAAALGRGLRVFFCYPTTGTATEGYRDYLQDVDLPTALVHGRAHIDMEMLSLGEGEPDADGATGAGAVENQPGRLRIDRAGALDHWSTPMISCTVDTVLGLLQNHRRGIYLWPSIAGAAVVFDEIHSYDDALFGALLRFLKEVRGVPCLLMTASLPEPRLERIKQVLASIGEDLGSVSGPEEHETVHRYRRDVSLEPWERVNATLSEKKRVLWVVNTVDEAIKFYEQALSQGHRATIYHSRFRYCDRVKRHQAVIDSFGGDGPVLALCTQVAEMSLDLSADLLVTQLAPIPALIQRLGRLNRRATRDDPWPFLVYRRDSPLPYERAELDEAAEWLDRLGNVPLCQRDLIGAWKAQPAAAPAQPKHAWIDGGFHTQPAALRKGSPGIEIVLPEDRDAVLAREITSAAVRIPMPPPRTRDWHAWHEVDFCKVPPSGLVEYDPMKGARWIR